MTIVTPENARLRAEVAALRRELAATRAAATALLPGHTYIRAAAARTPALIPVPTPAETG